MPIHGRWRLQPDSSPCTTGSFHTARGPIRRRIDGSVSPSTIRPRRQGPPAASDRQRCSCVAMIVTGISKSYRRQRANSRPRRSRSTIGLSASIERLTLKRKPPTICSRRDRGSASRQNAARSGLCRRRRARLNPLARVLPQARSDALFIQPARAEAREYGGGVDACRRCIPEADIARLESTDLIPAFALVRFPGYRNQMLQAASPTAPMQAFRPDSTRHWAPPKVRATSVQIAAHLSSAATASGLISEERSPGSWPSSAARTTRRIIFMLRVFGRSAMSTIAFGRNG